MNTQDLVKKTRDLIPNITISTDLIAGFCGETEEDHADTLSLMKEVRYQVPFENVHSCRD